MPQNLINVYDRHTYQTEKIKGFDIVRIFKASALTSENGGTVFQVDDGENIIQKFAQTQATNFKGTNLIDLTKLENFDSFRITANGTFTDDLLSSYFNFDFNIIENTNSLITNVRSNYGVQLDSLASLNAIRDWYLDIEVTFCIMDNGDYNFIVNGNYSTSVDIDNTSRGNVRLIPFNGSANISNSYTQVYLDIAPYTNGSDYSIKSINIDFVE